jgi:thioredoxin 1
MSGVITIVDQGFEMEVMQAKQPVLAYFWAAWCGPCRLMPPVMDSLAVEYGDRLKIVKIEVDPNPNAVAACKVQGVPAFRLFRQGEILEALEGAIPQPKLKEILEKHLTQ